MNRSALQPLRSRRHFSAGARTFPASPAGLRSAEPDTRQTLAAIGLIWVAAAGSFAAPEPVQRARPTAVAA